MAALALSAPAQPLEGEGMRIAPGTGRVVADGTASGGRTLLLTGRGSATLQLAAGPRARIALRVRGERCDGPPRLRAALDGTAALSERVSRRGWQVLQTSATGTRTLAVGLANPHSSARCRRALRIDRIDVEPIRIPAPTTTWQWQLSGTVDTSVDAQLYDVDLFETSESVVAELHAKGRQAICYLSAGSHERGRPDAGAFPASVRGKPLEGWPGERWLDVRRLDVLGPLLERRLDLCRDKGFDGVEADNVDGYANRSGFGLKAADQLRFNRFLAAAAHARGLSIGLKNDLGQVRALEPDFDWALNEQCFQYDECAALRPFTAAGKPVFVAEYELDPSAFCARAAANGFMAMRKRLELGPWRRPCW